MEDEEYTTIKLQPQFSPNRNISFGGDKEKEMLETFNIFDILWYAPENSEKLEEWVAFTNVNVIKETEEEKFKAIALLGRMLRLIIITTGAYAEKTIPKLVGLINISVFIYDTNLDYYQQWSKKYDMINGVYDNPKDLFEKLLDHQNIFAFPLFSYKMIIHDEFSFNYFDSLKNTELLLKDRNFTIKLNKYEKILSSCFCEYRLANMRVGNFFDNFRSDIVKIIDFFYGKSVFSIPGMEYYFANTIFDAPVKELNIFFLGLTIISAYFSKYPFLYGLLNYDEISVILKEELTLELLRNDYQELLKKHLIFLTDKLLKEKVSILEEKNSLKFLHSFLVKFLKLWKNIVSEFEYDNYSKFPIMIKYLMDIDFCLKLFFCDI